MIELLFPICVLIVSNLVWYKLYQDLKKTKPIQSHKSEELSEFLGDLMRGEGLVRVSRVAPNDVLIRSTRL